MTVRADSPLRTAIAALAVAAIAACTPPQRISHPVALGPGSDVPVIFMPGTSGTTLVETTTGRTVWGDFRSFFFPRDNGHALAAPLDGSADHVAAGSVMLNVGLPGYNRPVYGPLLESMQSFGYRIGNLQNPAKGDDFFFFAYDWRLGSVANAGELERKLENLRRARGEDVLHVALVAQSGAAHIARYFLKYGSSSLDQSESGTARPPSAIRVDKLVLVGTSNGGSIRILREMNRGRRYAPLGRYFSPEVFFTFQSLYDDLPTYTGDLFVDGAGNPVRIDLFDADQWRRYGWSVFDPDVERRIRKDARFGSEQGRLNWLRTRLSDARRLRALLERDTPAISGTRYYSIQDRFEPTPTRAVVTRGSKGWKTSFAGDPEVDRNPWLRHLVTSPGDRHATVPSQQWLSEQEIAAFAEEPLLFEGAHFEIVLNPAMHRRLAEILAAP